MCPTGGAGGLHITERKQLPEQCIIEQRLQIYDSDKGVSTGEQGGVRG